VLGALEVPIGKYTEQLLARASVRYGQDFTSRVEARVVSRELNVRQVLARVVLGEADAGIVYRTDATAQHDRVSVVLIDPELNVIAEYPMAILTETARPHLGAAWVSLVRSQTGRKLLQSFGFSTPPGDGAP
jgi:molybdate transport system substrate-binding protein